MLTLLPLNDYPEFLRLIQDPFNQHSIPILLHKFSISLLQVRYGPFLDDGGLKDIQNQRPILLLFLQHLLNELPQLLGVKLGDGRIVGLHHLHCQPVQRHGFERPLEVAHLIQDTSESPNVSS